MFLNWAREKSIESSTKKMWWSFGHYCLRHIPSKSFICVAWMIFWDRTSTTIMDKYGNIEAVCLVALVRQSETAFFG